MDIPVVHSVCAFGMLWGWSVELIHIVAVQANPARANETFKHANIECTMYVRMAYVVSCI